MADQKIPPLSQNNPIVEGSGKPRPFFVLLINQLLKGSVASAVALAQSALALAQAALDAVNALIPRVEGLEDTDIIAGVNLTGGGMLGDGDVTISHADSTVVTGTYGSATKVPRITVDQRGHLTGVTEVTIQGLPTGGTTGQALVKNSGTDYDVTWSTISGGGGGGGGGAVLFDMPVNSPSSLSGGANAIKGNRIRPVADISVTAVTAVMDSKVVSATYKAYITTLSGSNVGVIVASSATYTATNTSAETLLLPLTTAVTLTAGTEYALMVARTDGSGSYALPLLFASNRLAYVSSSLVNTGYVQSNTAGGVTAGMALTTGTSLDNWFIGISFTISASGAGTNPFSPGVPLLSTFTEVGAGTATKTEHIGGRGIVAACTANGSKFFYKTMPAAPYRLAVALTRGNPNGVVAMIGFLDTTANKNVRIVVSDNNTRIYIQKYSSLTSYVGDITNVAWLSRSETVWLALRDDGINIYYEFSSDGVTFVSIASEVKASGYLAGAYTKAFWGVQDMISGENVTVRTWDPAGLTREFPSV